MVHSIQNQKEITFMKKNTLSNYIVILIALIPLAYLAIIWKSIPAKVALHFNANLEPDSISDKSGLWIPALILTTVSVGVYFLLKNIKYLDPKRKGKPASETFTRLGFGLVVFFSALNIIIIYSATKGTTLISNLLFPLMGLLFAFIGNYMKNLRPNYFAGFRLPWTLSDDENWRKTHQFASKLWFWGGLIFAIISLFVTVKFIVPVMIAMIGIIVIIPIIYSFRIFKNKTAGNNVNA
jgi:uncharacterized membrane protein